MYKDASTITQTKYVPNQSRSPIQGHVIPNEHLTQHLYNWRGLNMRVYKAPGTMWEESDGDMKTVVKDNLCSACWEEEEFCFGNCEAILWPLQMAIFQRGSKVLIF